MNPILKNVLAVIGGIFIGSLFNFALIIIGDAIFPAPEGVNITDPESLKANIHLFEAKHFVFPLIAHAVGTLVGAFAAAKIGATHQMKLALGVGVIFLIFGTINVITLGGPIWFNTLDLALAYVPMGWLGGRWALRQFAE